jgi:hypothetical protein
VGWVIVAVVVAVVIVGGWLLWARSRKSAAPASPPVPERVSRVTDTAPMTGLEVALDEVTDSSGRKMRENLETGTAIDDLIVPEDTGPILRRALDNVEHSEPGAPEGATGSVETPASEPTGGETPTNGG